MNWPWTPARKYLALERFGFRRSDIDRLVVAGLARRVLSYSKRPKFRLGMPDFSPESRKHIMKMLDAAERLRRGARIEDEEECQSTKQMPSTKRTC